MCSFLCISWIFLKSKVSINITIIMSNSYSGITFNICCKDWIINRNIKKFSNSLTSIDWSSLNWFITKIIFSISISGSIKFNITILLPNVKVGYLVTKSNQLLVYFFQFKIVLFSVVLLLIYSLLGLFITSVESVPL